MGNRNGSVTWWLAPLCALAVGWVLVALYAGSAYGWSLALAGVLFACCSSAVGVLFGFLFGIPRALATSEANPGPRNMRASWRRYSGNTNLEQISDWLTKAIIGIGLVQATEIGRALQSGANRLAPFVSGAKNDGGAVLVIGCLFVVMGFIGGFLWTRVYLTNEFRRADDEALLSPEYYEGLMHAHLYRVPNGYKDTLRVADEFRESFDDSFTGRMCLYISCAYAQEYAKLKREKAGDAKLFECKNNALDFARRAIELEQENLGLIRGLWHPGPDDDPSGEFTVFKDDDDFKKLLEKDD